MIPSEFQLEFQSSIHHHNENMYTEKWSSKITSCDHVTNNQKSMSTKAGYSEFRTPSQGCHPKHCWKFLVSQVKRCSGKQWTSVHQTSSVYLQDFWVVLRSFYLPTVKSSLARQHFLQIRWPLIYLLRQRANAWNVSFRLSSQWPIHIINLVDKTKLSTGCHRLSTVRSFVGYQA